MASLFSSKSASVPAARPVLHLSGPKLRASMEALIKAAEQLGGIEKYVEAVKLKSEVFQDTLGGGKLAAIEAADFEQLAAHMATVRRRLGRLIDETGWKALRAAMIELVADAHVPGTADARLANFGKAVGEGRKHRFVRDLAVELLHNLYPEQYPLMTRWVWDNKANTGVLREIWHGDNVDHMVIDVPDTHETFLVLREELSQFLADNGVFRDMLWYVDLLKAQIYGDYINAQGGTYLRADFASEGDPLEHSKRLLGLDGVSPRTGRSRYKTIDAAAEPADPAKRLN